LGIRPTLLFFGYSPVIDMLSPIRDMERLQGTVGENISLAAY